MNNLKTVGLLAFMTALLFFIVYALGGRFLTAVVIVVGFNVLVYFFSDRMALAASRARPVSEEQLPKVYGIVRRLSTQIGIPMPSIHLIEKLKALGAKVDYNDPHIPRTPKQREHNLGMTSKRINARMLSSYDCILIATDHSAYDYDFIVEHAKLVVDTRNAAAKVRKGKGKVVKA